MTAGIRETSGPLAPLVSALLADARRDAEETLGLARADADATIAAAQEEADALLADARTKGRADGEAVVAGERARAERKARGIVLSAQREAHDQARRAARDAVSALRQEPDYPDLVRALKARAVAELGPGAHVTEPAGGGVTAAAGSQRIDYSFEALADDIVDRLGPQVEGIWAP